PKPISGRGTRDNPFGLPDLLNTTTTPVSQGPALTILKPGDTLFFRAGDYHITGSPDRAYYDRQLLGPTVSGTASQPVTLQAYQGETVRILLDGGYQPVFG